MGTTGGQRGPLFSMTRVPILTFVVMAQALDIGGQDKKVGPPNRAAPFKRRKLSGSFVQAA
jgi:hypothetical protein